ncbi:MAG: ATP-grasp domain-containing protein [Candidatus Babeliales bacterium]
MNKFIKLRIGVLMGGKSIEREVSFNSGRTVCDHIDFLKYEVVPIFQTYKGDLYILPYKFLHRGKISDFFDRLDSQAKKISWDDLKYLVDFIYLSIHGRFAEDGTVQGFLEVLGIPYLGAKIFASAIGMNKGVQKKILQSNGIDVPNGFVVTPEEIEKIDIKSILEKLEKLNVNFPIIVKPVHEGSSFGISLVDNKSDLLQALKNACYCDSRLKQDVIIEEKIKGSEFVCVCLQKDKNWFALPITQVVCEKNTNFFDYTQKYMPGRATKITPANFEKKDQENIVQTCIKVTKILNFSTISRIDGFLTKDGRVYIIDPNSLTGTGPATFLFHQAAEIGMSHTQLINYLVETELKNYNLKSVSNVNAKKDNNISNKKNRIVVLLGGSSNEREISLESGRNVCYKLSPEKYEIIPVFVDSKNELYKLNQRLLIQNSTREISLLVTQDLKINWADLPKICDFVFIGLHGGVGENGGVQGTLEMLDLPYNGSGVLTSSLCMDKFKTNEFLKSGGFDVPFSFLLSKTEFYSESFIKNFEKFSEKINLPVIIKPHDDGCSVGVKKVKNKENLLKEIDLYFKETLKEYVLIEEFIDAVELTCGVFGNQEVTALPPSKVFVAKDVLSMEEKFLPGAGENLTPAPLAKEHLEFIQDTIAQAYKFLGCAGYSRIDCFFQQAKKSPTKKNRLIILEVNTLPALTPATCIFHQAAEIGLRPMDFIEKIVELGFENYKNKFITSSQKDIQEQTL